MLTKDPWRREMTSGGIIGLDITLLRQIAGDIGMKRTERFYERLSIFEAEVMKFIQGDSRCDANQKEKCKIEFGEFLEWSCKNCERNKEVKRNG